MRWIAGLAVALGASLGLARVHPFGDAGFSRGSGVEVPAGMPAEVRAVLTAKCVDCHSEAPRVPFYGRLAPVSWMLEKDVVEARGKLNLSAWDRYTAEQRQTLAAKMVAETRSGKMPLAKYRAIHWGSGVTEAEVAALTRWSHSLAAGDTGAGGLQEGDAEVGAGVFERRCTGCHALASDREGPRLKGVFGRASGSVAGFGYSHALKATHMVWDEVILDRWLSDPDAMVPGTDMDFRVTKAQERTDLIAYLKAVAAR